MEAPRIPDSQTFGHRDSRSRSGGNNEVFKLTRQTQQLCAKYKEAGFDLTGFRNSNGFSAIRRYLDQTHLLQKRMAPLRCVPGLTLHIFKVRLMCRQKLFWWTNRPNPIFARTFTITCSLFILFGIRVARTPSIQVPFQERAFFPATQLAPKLAFLLGERHFFHRALPVKLVWKSGVKFGHDRTSSWAQKDPWFRTHPTRRELKGRSFRSLRFQFAQHSPTTRPSRKKDCWESIYAFGSRLALQYFKSFRLWMRST